MTEFKGAKVRYKTTNWAEYSSQTGCGPCEHRQQCLRYPKRSAVRKMAIFKKEQRSPNEVLQAMKQPSTAPRAGGDTVSASAR